MPVTARLSKKFYDRLGEDIATELVDWSNQVDTTYRGDLRELNELNFARSDAKLELRIAELRSELGQRLTEVESRLHQGMSALESTLDRRLLDHTRWMAAAWVTQMMALIAILLSR